LADVTLPSLGESVTEGIITQWFKKVGDFVARDEPLFEVSTDKVDSEMPSPAAGVLTHILAEEGDTVATGSRVAVIDESAGAGSGSVASWPASATPESATTAPPTPAPVPRSSLSTDEVISGVVAVLNGPTEEFGVAFINGRRRMGQHMTVSIQTSPHGFVAIEVDANIFATLDAIGDVTRDGFTISDEMLVSLAAVRALAEFEYLNASFDGEGLVVHRSVNLGFVRAVADDGMLVPVVHAAAGLTLRALVRRVAELDERVTSRHLTTDDLMGGTFTIAGAPSAHTLWSQPIIIQPQVAVLSVGAIRQVPVVVQRDGGATLDIGRRVVLGLSFDHRVCEAVAAADYLERVAELLAGIDIEGER
jgi:pyruvate/2-oxoglutarate dehydrogenase complex dihydrolipoamide acyltransferase (E2) component